MKIGILLTSNDESPWALRFPNDGEKFRSLLQPLRQDWSYEIYPVKDDIFPADIGVCDGYIITGSPASVHDGHGWIGRLEAFIEELHQSRRPLIGACFGHQIIAKALGGKVEKNPQGWVIGTETTTYIQTADWMVPASKTLTLYAAHKEQVTGLPREATTIGTAPGCPHAAFTIGSHIMTNEYHPEMTRDFMETLVDEMAGVLEPEQMATARRQFETAPQGALFGAWMVNFLERISL